MKIWLDDERPVPDSSWTLCKTYQSFLDVIANHPHDIEEISFDHDLGDFSSEDKEKTGYDAICLIEYLVMIDEIKPPYCHVHTANASVARKMNQAAHKINVEYMISVYDEIGN